MKLQSIRGFLRKVCLSGAGWRDDPVASPENIVGAENDLRDLRVYWKAPQQLALTVDRSMIAAERSYAAWIRTGLAALASRHGCA